jgi:type VI secretion system secreted protein Hcp
MRRFHAGRFLVLCSVVCAALMPAAPARAAIDSFMTLTGAKQGIIRGDGGSEKIQLVSVVRDASTGMSAGKRQHSPIIITKKIDMASPKLATASTSHETLGNVTITFEGVSRGTKAVEKIVLTNATILSVRKAGGNEIITLDYQAIEVTWTDGGKTATDDWEAPTN